MPHPIPSAMLSEFHADLCWLMVSEIVSWRVVEHPFWHYFFAKWVPGSVLPGRDVLSGQILDDEVVKADAKTKDEVWERYVMGQCDSWKNIAKKNLIASMMNAEYKVCCEIQSWIWCVANLDMFCYSHIFSMSQIFHQSQKLLKLSLILFEYVTKVLFVFLVAWCTDASDESTKMRRLLHEKHKWIIVLDCWAHQLNLVTGDVLKPELLLINVANQALEVIKWFSNHSIVLGLLNQEQWHIGTATPLVLILPVITWWTSHYLAMDCLVTLEVPFRRLILDQSTKDKLILSVGKQHEAKDKAQKILWTIDISTFWTKIKRYIKIFHS